MKLYKYSCIATSLLFVALFFNIQFDSEGFVSGLGQQPCEEVYIVLRRASIFMLGLAVLLFLARNLTDLKAKQYISISTCITMLGLATMGSYEFFRGAVNSSIFFSVAIESISALFFFLAFFKMLKIKTGN